MQDRHLSREQLIAFRDGALDDSRALAHLATCPRCQRAFDDSRWLLALSRLRGKQHDQAHPDRDLLVGYLTHALDREEAARVSRHLRSCDRCVVRYRRFRDSEAATGYSSPPPALLRATQRRFSSRPAILELGELVLRKLGEALVAEYSPVQVRPGFAKGSVALLSAPDEETLRRVLQAPELRRRVRDRTRHAKQELVERSLEAEDAGERIEAMREESFSARRAGPTLGPEPSDTHVADSPLETRIDHGSWRLTVAARPEEDGAILLVSARDRGTRRPIEGMTLTLESASGERHDAATASDGRARLPISPGRSTLLIRERESARLVIEYLG